MSPVDFVKRLFNAFREGSRGEEGTNEERRCPWSLDGFHLDRRGPDTGLSLFREQDYLATYTDGMECLLDMAFHWDCKTFSSIVDAFGTASSPIRYRGVCSEIFWPTETIFRHVCYGNKLADIFERFSVYEKRAAQNETYFEYGVQGTGIHMFNAATRQYEFWLGGDQAKSVTDLMQEVKTEHKNIPTNLPEEVAATIETKGWDVFISHKSEAYPSCKTILDILTAWGKKVFLSEVSLPLIGKADYCSTISECLEQSRHLLVFADSTENLVSGWVKYEWESFLNEKLSGHKNGNLVVVLSASMSPKQLPYALRQFQAVPLDDIDAIRPFFP